MIGHRAKIIGTGSELGRFEVPTAEIILNSKIDRFGFSLDLVSETMGITHVRHSDLQTKPGDLAIMASEKAIKQCQVDPRSIEAVIYCGIEGDYVEPATAHKVAHALDIAPRYCWDKSDACHGFTAGLLEAELMIAAGRIRTALICTGEHPSNKTHLLADLFATGHLGSEDVMQSLGGFTVGDAGGAMILTRSESPAGIIASNTTAISALRELCYCDTSGADRGQLPKFSMEMGKICARTIRLVRKMLPESLNCIGWHKSDIDYLIPHQVGERPFLKYLDIFGLTPDQSVATYAKFGNLASATIPVCWDILQTAGRLEPGKRVFIVSTGSGIVVSHLGISL